MSWAVRAQGRVRRVRGWGSPAPRSPLTVVGLAVGAGHGPVAAGREPHGSPLARAPHEAGARRGAERFVLPLQGVPVLQRGTDLGTAMAQARCSSRRRPRLPTAPSECTHHQFAVPAGDGRSQPLVRFVGVQLQGALALALVPWGSGRGGMCGAGTPPSPPPAPRCPRTRSVDGEEVTGGLVGGPGAEEDGSGLSHAGLGGVGTGGSHRHAGPGGQSGCQGGRAGAVPDPDTPGLPYLPSLMWKSRAKPK